MMHLAVATLLALAQTNDKAQANGYDDAWKTGWTNHCRTVLQGGSGKVDGFVIHIGDSITWSGAYGAWMRSGAGGKSTEDRDVTDNWINNFPYPGGVDANSHYGLYLAAKDINPPGSPPPPALRSMTAVGGIQTYQYKNGSGHGSVAMPSTMNVGTAQGYLMDGTYDADLNIETVASACVAAQAAVVMLGTNDCNAGRAASDAMDDLAVIVSKLEARNIVVILSTIPPNPDSTKNGVVQQFNGLMKTYAQSTGLPLIDFNAEIIARQPTAWNGTLLNSGDVHPSGSYSGAAGTFDLNSDIYANGGSSTTHKTGAAAAYVGYLLRSWLTAQKLKEVRSFVVQGQTPVLANPTTPTPSGPTPPAPTPTPTLSTPSAPKSGGGGGGKCGGTVAGPVSPLTLLGAAIAALALARAARKTGF